MPSFPYHGEERWEGKGGGGGGGGEELHALVWF